MTSGNRGSMPAADAAASTAEPSTNGFYVAGRCWPWRPHRWARWEPVTLGLWDGETHLGDRYGQQRACLRCGKEQVRRVRD